MTTIDQSQCPVCNDERMVCIAHNVVVHASNTEHKACYKTAWIQCNACDNEGTVEAAMRRKLENKW